MAKRSYLCVVNNEYLREREFFDLLKSGCKVDEIRTKFTLDEFFAKFGEYCFKQTKASMRHLEGSPFFKEVGRITLDFYLPHEYTIIHVVNGETVYAVMKEAE